MLASAAIYLLVTASGLVPGGSSGAQVERPATGGGAVVARVDRSAERNAAAIEVEHLTVHSAAVGEDLGVSVLEPPGLPPRGRRPLLVFLHGRGGSDQTFVGDQAVLEGLAKQGARAPIVAFPDGGDHGYWHDRAEGEWGKYVMREAIPQLSQRYGVDPRRIAIGGISMGGFGAYDLALLHPRRFCAVGGHSPALWFAAGETAPGAFDGSADFNRNDVVKRVRSDPDAFGQMRIWNDYGSVDPFRTYDEGFLDALDRGDAKLTSHTWPGAHNTAYWDAHWPAYLHFYATALAHCG